MRTLRVIRVGTVILALLGGLGGLALAQSGEEGSGVVTMESKVPTGEGYEADGTYWNAHAVETSDPRLSGAWTESWRCQTGAGFEMCVGTVRVENEGGTWLGRVEGFGPDERGVFDWTVLEGQGDYEGLTAIRLISVTPGSEVEEMVILDFEMPAQPEPKMPPAE